MGQALSSGSSGKILEMSKHVLGWPWNGIGFEEEAIMTRANQSANADDPYNLRRFVEAQAEDYEQALAEIRRGRKSSHWMWYIFPQFEGLGHSSMSRRYAIKSLAEAKSYLAHPVLGPRLLACAESAWRVEGRSALDIFGSPDDIKLRSCATLFAAVSPPGSVFERLLDKYFEGKADEKTLHLLRLGQEEE
jgi:uncharacterized protein (DUF1810 family)